MSKNDSDLVLEPVLSWFYKELVWFSTAGGKPHHHFKSFCLCGPYASEPAAGFPQHSNSSEKKKLHIQPTMSRFI